MEIIIQSRTLILIFLCIIIGCRETDSNRRVKCIFWKNSLDYNQLKGKVKTVGTKVYNAAYLKGRIDKNGFKNVDENTVEEFNKDGLLKSSFRNKSRTVIFFKSNGCPDEIRDFKDGNLKSVSKLQYDYVNNAITEVKFDGKGLEKGRVVTKYMKSGNEEIYNLTSRGDTQSKAVYVFNTREEREFIKIYNSKGELIHCDTTIYDYNLNSVTTYPSDRFGPTKVITLRNQQNFEIEKYEVYANTYRTNYDYVYDKIGNWIKKTEFINGEPQFITERIISYY